MCDYKATYEHNLYKHVKFIHQARENIICTMCNKSFKQPNCLREHKKAFHSDEKTQYYCDLCTFKTVSKAYLKKHKIKVH